MQHVIGQRVVLFLILCLAVLSSFADEQASTPETLNAAEIVARWREAVHMRQTPTAAVLRATSNEDGIPGDVREWLTNDSYRRSGYRQFDDSELVVSPNSASRRDWNGRIREIRGQELQRLHAQILEAQALVLGPPSTLSQASVSVADDGKSYVLRYTPSESSPITWYIDAKTWLPVKSVRPGEDSEITTTYDDWQPVNGVLIPHRALVQETDKPEYRWTLQSLVYERNLPAATFAPPKPGPSDAHLEPNAAPIPFTLESNHIVFKISVNGHLPIGFILDTGADQNVINETRMADFGLHTYAKTITTGGGGSAEYGYAAGTTFTLPGVELRNQHVAVLEQTGLERALGFPLGGLLGYDFISRFVVEIDYQKLLITLHDPAHWSYRGSGAIVPLTFDVGIPFMDGAISVPTKPNIPAYLVLDFGAAETMTLTSPFVKANDLVRLAQTNATVNRPAGLENQFFAQNNVRGRIDQLTIGTLTVSSIPVNMSVNSKGAYASSTFSGTVGETIYRRYHVFLDYARNRVIFEATPEASRPFPNRQTYGLTLLASGADLHTFTVAAVRPGSPAEKDGFQKGDVIAGMDEKPAMQFTLSQLREYLSQSGEHHVLKVTRSGSQLTMPIEVRLVSIEHN
jgi:hypothetical protein